MTRDDIMRMVREVADSEKVDPVCSQGDFITLTPDELERFVSMVAAAEREECAKECDAVGRHPPVDEWSKGYRGGGQDCAASVRSRGKK